MFRFRWCHSCPILLTALVSAVHAGVWSGSIETLLQSDSYFPDRNWFEQWITLDHRSREEHRSLHLSGNYGLSSDKSELLSNLVYRRLGRTL